LKSTETSWTKIGLASRTLISAISAR